MYVYFMYVYFFSARHLMLMHILCTCIYVYNIYLYIGFWDIASGKCALVIKFLSTAENCRRKKHGSLVIAHIIDLAFSRVRFRVWISSLTYYQHYQICHTSRML